MSKVLALTLGDRYGVGPELVAKLLSTLPLDPSLHVVVVGDARVLERGRAVIGETGAVPRIGSFAEGRSAAGGWSLLHRPFEAEVTPIGRVSTESGRETLVTLKLLADAALANEIDGIVYGPLNKQAMRDAGHAAGDEAEYFAQCFAHQGPIGEINILGDVWTSRVTSHVPLREVGNLITRENVLRGVRLLAEAQKRTGITPRLAMAALNPHAGEGGAFGREEIDVLAPAIAEAQAEGIDIAGPFPSDTVFPRAVGGAFNGVVTMFHDQGQIALKMVGLGQGITLLGGFPVPIATPGHGTAFDIAGKGIAKAEGLAAATALVGRMIA
jgi:4-hydroxythreonine-4-phosphate dehydrogenase